MASATGSDQNGAPYSLGAIAWLSSSTTVATVGADGKVNALAPGTALITATSGSKSGQATLTVISAGLPCVGTRVLGCGLGIDQFSLIPAGSFQMGSNGGYFSNETPVHAVTVTHAFYLQKSEVTQGQWRAVTAGSPSKFAACGDLCPVEQVSWDDVQTFLQQLNTLTPGVTYRLPTEAEWEYAARAGTTTENYAPIDSIAWYAANSSSRSHPVGGKRANSWALFDMMGNVFEWVSDRYGAYGAEAAQDPAGPASGTDGIIRGGGWYAYGVYSRAASRVSITPATRSPDIGFRLVRFPVAASIPVATVTVTSAGGTLTVGQTLQFSATARDASGNILTGCDFSWSSSNTAVATISAGGLVTGMSAGTATITASCGNKSGTLTATVSAAGLELTVLGAGTGTGTVEAPSAGGQGPLSATSTAGVMSGTSRQTYPSGTVVTLTATAASGSTFAGWSAGVCSGTGTCAVTMSQARNVTATFNVATVPATSTLAILNGQVVNGVIDLNGGRYSKIFPWTMLASGGSVNSGYTWTATPGRVLPHPAIFISPLQGVITGSSTTLQRGTFTMYVDVRDDAGTTRSGQVTVNLTRTCNSADISSPCMEAMLDNIHSDYLPAGKVGVDYAATILTSGGTPPYSWALASGSLPPGIVIDAARGVLRGSPTTAGTYNFYVRTTDAVGSNTDLWTGVTDARFRLVINP